MSNLTPQQKLLANQFLLSSQKNTNAVSQTELVEEVEKEISKKKEEKVTENINDIKLSRIETVFNNIDSEHDIILKNEYLINANPSHIFQVGYEIFESRSNASTLISSSNKSNVVPKNYKLSPGDNLTVFLYGKKEQVLDVTLDTSGDVFFPSIGPIKLSGLTLAEASRKMESNLSKKYVNFSFKLILNSIEKVPITISGDVKKPGIYMVDKFDSLIQVLAMADGINKTGSLRNIKIISSDQTKKSVDLYQFIITEKRNNIVALRSGDTIHVPKIGDTVAIKGAVKSPGIYELKLNESVNDLIHFADGYNVDAYKNAIYINRMDHFFKRKVSVIFNQDESEVAKLLTQRKLKNGDLIVVRSRSDEVYGYVNIQGNVQIEGKYEYVQGLTFRDIISQARGLRENTHDTVQIYRYLNEDERELVNISIENDSFPINNRDIIRVFNNFELMETPSINITGEVLFPGDYIYAKGMTLKDILLLGQPKNFASLVNIEITRYAGKTSNILFLNYSENESFEIKPNDKINIKLDNLRDETATIELKGEIRFPGIYRVNKGAKLSDVIEKAGGYTKNAFLDGAIFLRKDVEYKDQIGQQKVLDDEKKRLIYDQSHLGNLSMDSQVSLGVMMTARQEALTFLEEKTKINSGRIILDLTQDKFENSNDNFTIQDGDSLEIPTTPESVHLVGGVQKGISIAYNEGFHLNQYVNNVGGYTKYADRHNIYVFKASGKVIRNSHQISPGDIIYVPENVNISFNWLQFLTNITSIISNAVTSIALIQSLQ